MQKELVYKQDAIDAIECDIKSEIRQYLSKWLVEAMERENK